MVNDPVFEKLGIMAWVHAPSDRLFFGFCREFCVYSQKYDPISIKFPSESATIDERIFQTLGKKGIERSRIEKGVLKFRLELNLGDIVDGCVVEIRRKLENLIYANFDAINTLILGNNPGCF